MKKIAPIRRNKKAKGINRMKLQLEKKKTLKSENKKSFNSDVTLTPHDGR